VRPAGIKVPGSSRVICCSSRTARSAWSSRVLASVTRAVCVSFPLPADSWALRFIVPAKIFGRPALPRLREALLARRAARSRAC